MGDKPDQQLANIFWIGGPAAAGKTTVSRLLARKHGFLWYSADAHAFDHERRAAAAGLHVLGTGPGDFDRKPMIGEDIQSLPLKISVIVEGAQITPDLAGTTENALWLMPSQEEQLARLERRHPGAVHKDYRWGWTLIQSQLQGTNARILAVDGQTVEETIAAVEQSFSPTLAASPAARTTEERQSLTRLSNHQLAEQAIERSRSTGTGGHPAVTFDCECGQPTCLDLIRLAVESIPALAHDFPPIISPDHTGPT